LSSGCRKKESTPTVVAENASGDDKGKSQSQKDVAISGDKSMYFNSISRSASNFLNYSLKFASFSDDQQQNIAGYY